MENLPLAGLPETRYQRILPPDKVGRAIGTRTRAEIDGKFQFRDGTGTGNRS